MSDAINYKGMEINTTRPDGLTFTTSRRYLLGYDMKKQKQPSSNIGFRFGFGVFPLLIDRQSSIKLLSMRNPIPDVYRVVVRRAEPGQYASDLMPWNIYIPVIN